MPANQGIDVAFAFRGVGNFLYTFRWTREEICAEVSRFPRSLRCGIVNAVKQQAHNTVATTDRPTDETIN